MAIGKIFIFENENSGFELLNFYVLLLVIISGIQILYTRTTTTYDDTTLVVDGVLCNIIIWAWQKNV